MLIFINPNEPEIKSNLLLFIFFLLLTILSLKNDKFEYADNFTLILMRKKLRLIATPHTHTISNDVIQG